MPEVNIRILGAGREVGRSAILVEAYGKKILLDYGVAINEEEPQFPLVYPPKYIDLIVLSHAHLDHSGALPLLYVSCTKPLYTTELTLSLTELLIRDFLKISGYYLPYEFNEFKRLKENTIFVDYNRTYEIGNIRLTFYNAGHIPGSLGVLLEVEDVRILYTGDYNTVETCLLSPANFDVHDIDILITEGTYALFNHPERDEVEKDFIEATLEVLDQGGNVLIPCFAVGRSQEILCVLYKYGIDYPIYLDGLARTVSEILLEYPKFLRDSNFFKKAYKSVIKVRGWEDRRRAIKEPSVIIAPAGMLKGGPSVYYLDKLNEDKNALFFVSYQSKNTPGRNILENGMFTGKGKPERVRAKVKWFDFSSHCGKRELQEFIRNLGSNTKIVIVHTEEETGYYFKDYCEKQLGLETYLPQTGDQILLRIK